MPDKKVIGLFILRWGAFIFRLRTWNFQEGAVFKCKTEDMVRPKKPIYEELKGEVHKRKGDEEALSPEKQTI